MMPPETLITVDNIDVNCPRCHATQHGVLYWHGDEDFVIANLEPALMHRCPVNTETVEEPRGIVDIPLPW